MLKKIAFSILGLAAVVAIPAFAETGGASTSTRSSSQINLACVQTAVGAREQAISAAFATFSTAESAALSARAAALQTAWGITESKVRRSAIKAAWSTFKTANKNAFKALRTSRKSAWATFKTASKACRAPVEESAEAEGTGSLGL